jgi:Response regulators consisting of a CheY-like receiver domain and a winged-helix DNA-binding domain
MIDKKVLIIDDDPDLRQLAGMLFKKAGAQIFTAQDGLDGISKLFTCNPSLIILDVVMPEINGFEVCRRIRQVSDIPIIMLTSLNHEKDMLQGLDSGADDFLSKPFSGEVLIARAKTVLRRSQKGNPPSPNYEFNNGHLSIDIDRRQVLVEEKRLKLSPIEFRLLVYLARHAGKVLTFDHILTNVWGTEYKGSMDYVHVYVSHLRNKIEENPKDPRYILTVHGIGYMFER